MIMPSGKGQYFKIWDKVSIEKLQNEHQWSWRVNKVLMSFCVELCLLFSAGQLINSRRMRCQAVVQALGSSTRYWALIMSLKSMSIDEIKDPCDNKHENPCKSSPCHFICLCLCCGSCGERSVRLNGLSPLFKCPYMFVCLLVHTFVWIHVNVHVRMHNNQRDIGKHFHQHIIFFLVT